MDDIRDFEIIDESGEGGIQYTLYNKGLPRLRLEEWKGRLYVQQMMIGPIEAEEFKVIAHGLTEFLLLLEGVSDEYYKRKTSAPKKRERNKRRRRA